MRVKRIISFGFLVLMLWQLIGFFTYFEISHFYVKKEIKTALKKSVPENHRKLYYFTASQEKSLHWIKSNEFKLNNRYYDVVERTESNGKVRLSCIDDIQETHLFKQLGVQTASSLSKGSGKIPLNSWFQLLRQPFLIVENLTFSPMYQIKGSDLNLKPYKNNFKEVYLLQYPSPPKCLV